MASWEQEITELLREVQDVAVRFDIEQELTNTQKATAKNNIGIVAEATQLSGDDYKLSILW